MQIQEAQERMSALQEEMAETLGQQYDPVLPSALRQSSARKPLPAALPRETGLSGGRGMLSCLWW
ncbi:transposase domain-containing protein [Escherichia coli]